jgi:hypothetical protein
MGRCSAGALLVAVALALVTHEGAAADTKRACIDANEKAQVARKAGRLRDARAALVSCGADACPQAVRADCARMLVDVTASMPTLVVEARDAAGAETIEVRVLVDGALVAERLAGIEIDVDPGAHRLRFELRDGTSREQSLVLSEGDKRRRIAVDFSRDAHPGGDVPGSSATSETPSATPASHGSALPWILGGLGVVAGVVFGAFAIAGYSQEQSLAKNCAPHCTPDQVSPVRTDYVLSDVALGVAVVSLGAGGLVVWRERARPSSGAAWRVEVGPLPGGGRVAAAARW